MEENSFFHFQRLRLSKLMEMHAKKTITATNSQNTNILAIRKSFEITGVFITFSIISFVFQKTSGALFYGDEPQYLKDASVASNLPCRIRWYSKFDATLVYLNQSILQSVEPKHMNLVIDYQNSLGSYYRDKIKLKIPSNCINFQFHKVIDIFFFEYSLTFRKQVFKMKEQEKLNFEQLASIAKINKEKCNRVTPGTHIPIISEGEARAAKPVIFWFFRGILKTEFCVKKKSIWPMGENSFFPFPEIEIV